MYPDSADSIATGDNAVQPCFFPTTDEVCDVYYTKRMHNGVFMEVQVKTLKPLNGNSDLTQTPDIPQIPRKVDMEAMAEVVFETIAGAVADYLGVGEVYTTANTIYSLITSVASGFQATDIIDNVTTVLIFNCATHYRKIYVRREASTAEYAICYFGNSATFKATAVYNFYYFDDNGDLVPERASNEVRGAVSAPHYSDGSYVFACENFYQYITYGTDEPYTFIMDDVQVKIDIQDDSGNRVALVSEWVDLPTY